MAKTRYLDDQEVADIVRRDKRTVRRWRERGILGYRKIGGTVQIYYPFRAPDGSFFKQPERPREK